MSWEPLYRHIKTAARMHVVSSSVHYRRLAKMLPTKNDTVLEVGCSSGLATKVLAKSAKQVTALDNSFDFIQRCQETSGDTPNVSFMHIDGRDLESVTTQCPNPDIIFFDIGGNAMLGNVCSVLRLYLKYFSPRIYVVRSIELALLNAMVEDNEIPEESRRIKNVLCDQPHLGIDYILELSHSTVVNDRMLAVKKLFLLDDERAKQRLQEMADDPNVKVRKVLLRG
ncbi:MAG: hypothetical protein DHS20C10_06310 [marine bacterium B5-7]|nr:MAG: hypothetical protein DHS20C10_06310 [marine bacterium B5-7]